MTDKTLLQEARDALAKSIPLQSGIWIGTTTAGEMADAHGEMTRLLTRLDSELAKVEEPVTSMALTLSMDSDAVDIARGYLGDSDADSLLDELTELFSTRQSVVLDLSGVRTMTAGKMSKGEFVNEYWYDKEAILAAIRAQLPGIGVLT